MQREPQRSDQTATGLSRRSFLSRASARSRSGRFRTHISGIFENTASIPVGFWQTMGREGYRPAQLGTSYYPSSGAIGGTGHRFTWLKQTAAAPRAALPQAVVHRRGWLPIRDDEAPYPYNTPVPGYPLSDAGQHAFIRELVSWGASSGHLAGFRPWAPDLCTPDSNWEPMSLFATTKRLGKPKPVLKAIAQGQAGC